MPGAALLRESAHSNRPESRRSSYQWPWWRYARSLPFARRGVRLDIDRRAGDAWPQEQGNRKGPDPWTGLNPGASPSIPTKQLSGLTFDVTVEIPKGQKNKYEVDHETGRIRLDRTLFTSTQYPADYGYIEGTLGQDGDPLDALVLVSEPTFRAA